MTTVFAATEAATEESGNFLVSPSVGLMIWLLLAFFVTLFILRKYAFPAIGEALDRRQRAIEESIDSAERTRHEADALLAEYRQRLTDARAQADEIVAKAEKAGEVAKHESLEAAKTQREELLERR
jgi:F-type H+-transporting ATPase subunit b